MVVGATSLVARNWDLAVVAVVVAAALLADLWRGLRPRDFLVAGPDGVVTRVRGVTTSRPWAAVTGLEQQRGRFGRSRPVLRLGDGTTAPLPRRVPVDELAEWLARRDGEDPAPG
ncbi:hypothetical protein [Jannaschia sp. R86511]|uniref:hypothetical protein n=1 Tax=Jannaschia sp. R86511 TaxID=3093853 RepID=UPI0036D2EDBD